MDKYAYKTWFLKSLDKLKGCWHSLSPPDLAKSIAEFFRLIKSLLIPAVAFVTWLIMKYN